MAGLLSKALISTKEGSMSEHLSEQSSPTDAQPWTCLSCGKENQGKRRFCWNCETVKGSSSAALPARPLRGTPPSHTPDIEPPRADSPPPSSDLLTENDATKLVKTKTSAISVLRMTVGYVAGFVGVVVGLLGLRDLLGDSNALGFYCNMPVALALLVFAWVMIRPKQ
jgi:hypothetical protein